MIPVQGGTRFYGAGSHRPGRAALVLLSNSGLTPATWFFIRRRHRSSCREPHVLRRALRSAGGANTSSSNASCFVARDLCCRAATIVVLKICLCLLALVLLCRTGFAQVPESGRWQDLDFSEEEMNSRGGARYHDMLRELAAKHRLDDDRAQLRRIRRVSVSLVRAAIAVKPAVASWRWEAHSTSDPAYEALCMPGGKLLIGTHFLRRLALTDGELATLVGHEIAHALADHYRETLTAVRQFNGGHPDRSLDTLMEQLETDLSLQLRLAKLNRIQEAEADQLGMSLAHRAGWPAPGMVSFYRKLASVDPPGFIDWTHPSATSRLSMATALAVLYAQ